MPAPNTMLTVATAAPTTKSSNQYGLMHEEDMRRLNNTLTERLNDGKLTAKQILDLLNSLEKAKSSEGELRLIDSNGPFFKLLKKQCEEQLINESK